MQFFTLKVGFEPYLALNLNNKVKVLIKNSIHGQVELKALIFIRLINQRAFSPSLLCVIPDAEMHRYLIEPFSAALLKLHSQVCRWSTVLCASFWHYTSDTSVWRTCQKNGKYKAKANYLFIEMIRSFNPILSVNAYLTTGKCINLGACFLLFFYAKPS